jgi:hypothetical protein
MTSSTSQTLTTNSPKLSLSTLWWNTNLPSAEHTPACPPYLTYALSHPKERANISTLDADFKRLTWPEVRAHVVANRLDQFTRVPSELRRYRQYTEKLVREYGSVMRFVLDERLGWRDSRAGEGRFADEGMCLVTRSSLHALKLEELRAYTCMLTFASEKTTTKSCSTTGPTASTRASCTSSSGPSSPRLPIL